MATAAILSILRDGEEHDVADLALAAGVSINAAQQTISRLRKRGCIVLDTQRRGLPARYILRWDATAPERHCIGCGLALRRDNRGPLCGPCELRRGELEQELTGLSLGSYETRP